jgi:anti-sigma-K factor RskA
MNAAAIHTLAGAYALDALSADEAAYFEQHLGACDGCAQEVAELQGTVASLGSSAAAPPPADLRARVLAAARSQPQLPPLTVPPLAQAGPAATPSPSTPITSARSSAARRWITAAAASVGVAAAAIAAFAIAGADVWPFGEPNNAPVAVDPLHQGVARVIDAPDAQSAATKIRGGGKLTVYNSSLLGKTAVVLNQLPRLDTEHDYQMWLVNDRGAKPIAVVPRVAEPEMLLPEVKPGVKIAITREPAGGSPQPTMEPLAYVTTA